MVLQPVVLCKRLRLWMILTDILGKSRSLDLAVQQTHCTGIVLEKNLHTENNKEQIIMCLLLLCLSACLPVSYCTLSYHSFIYLFSASLSFLSLSLLLVAK